jgi:subtilase family serine protease
MRLKPFQIVITVALVATAIATSLLGSSIRSRAAGAPPNLITLPHSVPGQLARAHLLGPHAANAQLTISLLLAMNQPDQARNLVSALYDPQSPQYHQWLPTGQFAAQFGPTASQVAAAKAFLTQQGLTPVATNISPFILQAQGSFSQVEAAFHVSVNDYLFADGQTAFSNANNLQIPASLKGVVRGVEGLNNIAAEHPALLHPVQNANYGAGPRGTGLTPAQIASIYNANPVYTQLKAQGQGTTLAVFELSNYTSRDLLTYQKFFHLHSVPIVNMPVDGGAGADHSGALEDELDIELLSAMVPLAKRILVYHSPNTDMSAADQYLRIASDNAADVISTSWGLCEPLAATSPSMIQGEYTAFLQMAMQGQSIFAASGDSGAADCASAQPDNTTPQVDDPASQPYMTGVGGTSFYGRFDPGMSVNPSYPLLPAEQIWNNDLGSGGGGVSTLWASPSYQAGPGVVEQGYSQSGAFCQQPAGTLCREVPDISMNADPDSGYAVYCADPGAGLPPGAIGFLQIGGTSAAAPLWAAIAALAISYRGSRLGLFSPYAYHLDSASGYVSQFHDISEGNNGNYPAEAGYDMSSGVGSPNIYGLVTALKTLF